METEERGQASIIPIPRTESAREWEVLSDATPCCRLILCYPMIAQVVALFRSGRSLSFLSLQGWALLS
jgi:hypothetical protein